MLNNKDNQNKSGNEVAKKRPVTLSKLVYGLITKAK
jgi:hypothetical protein